MSLSFRSLRSDLHFALNPYLARPGSGDVSLPFDPRFRGNAKFDKNLLPLTLRDPARCASVARAMMASA